MKRFGYVSIMYPFPDVCQAYQCHLGFVVLIFVGVCSAGGSGRIAQV